MFEGLFNFFSEYNFTIDENDPYENEVGIDPEMLGHIFENLLEDNKDKLEKMATELLRREVLSYKDIEEILGKRPNLDDGMVPVSEEDDASKSVSVQPDIAAGQITDEERKALEAAVEKLKSSRENRA
ncbi:MAG: hypothetical protein HGB11_13250 [Chlorobiales bacterium]|nr:hypothetical protein [Chlorobiales bacterium]